MTQQQNHILNSTSKQPSMSGVTTKEEVEDLRRTGCFRHSVTGNGHGQASETATGSHDHAFG